MSEELTNRNYLRGFHQGQLDAEAGRAPMPTWRSRLYHEGYHEGWEAATNGPR